MDVVSKLLSAGHPLPQILLLSGVFACLFALPAGRALGGLRVQSAGTLLVVLARGVPSVAMIWLTLAAFTRMPIADVYAVRFTSPILAGLLALMLLREAPTGRQWMATALGFAGVVVMLRPGGEADGWGAAAAFGAAAAQAVSMLTVRHWRARSTLLADMVLPVVILIAVNAALLPGRYVPPTPREWLLYATAGLMLAGGRLCLAYALRLARPGLVAPVQYSQMVWALLFGWMAFGTVPDATLAAGAAAVIAGSVLLGLGASPDARPPYRTE